MYGVKGGCKDDIFASPSVSKQNNNSLLWTCSPLMPMNPMNTQRWTCSPLMNSETAKNKPRKSVKCCSHTWMGYSDVHNIKS
jgi:hypothetical protein